jgi:hypothetical protein
MPERFVLLDDLREFGVARCDLKGRNDAPLATRLKDTPAKLLRSLLESTGFDVNDPIHVHESQDPPGFVFRQ